MEKGFTLKSFIIVLAVIIVMVLAAFFVQRKEKEVLTEEIPIEEQKDINQNEIYINDDNDEELIYQEDDNKSEIIETIEIIEVDCGSANYLATRAKQDLSSRLSISTNDIKTVSCQENVFSDHTLGTSNPGQIYPQTPTIGYVIMFLANDQEYIYYVDENNTLFVN